MFRPLLQSARCAVRATQAPRAAAIRPAVQSAKPSFTPSLAIAAQRRYASGGALAQNEVEGRIMDLLKGFDKVLLPVIQL